MSSSQASSAMVETSLSHINKLRDNTDKECSLDAQVEEFLSAARQKPSGENLVIILYERRKAMDAELAETKES